MENFLVILERVMIALRDRGPGKELTGQNLNLTAKEKLLQQDVQAYKYWLIEHYREDTFENLVNGLNYGFKLWKKPLKRQVDLETSLMTRRNSEAVTDVVTADLTTCTSRTVASSARARRITLHGYVVHSRPYWYPNEES